MQLRFPSPSVKSLLQHKAEVALAIAIVAYAAYFSYITVIKHLSFNSTVMDLGLFDQILWSTLQGDFFWTSTEGGHCHFARHNSPILFAILPLYLLLPRPETLLVLQSVLLALGGVPLYLLAKDELGKTGGLAVSCAYLLYPPLHGVNLFDFHELAFAPVILFTCFYFLMKGKTNQFLAFAVLALMIKEDIAPIVALMAVYGLREKKYPDTRGRYALYGLISLAIAWTLVSLLVITPCFSASGPYPYYSRYDLSDPAGLLLSNLPQKMTYLAGMLGPLVLLPLAAPSVFLIAVPSILEVILQSEPHVYTADLHHCAAFIPVLFVAAVVGLKRVYYGSPSAAGRPEEGERNERTDEFGRLRLNVALLLLLAFSTGAFLVNSPASPASPLHCDYTVTPHHEYLNEAIALIPPGVSVSTQNDIGAHLMHRRELYLSFVDGVDYVLADITLPWIVDSGLRLQDYSEYEQIYRMDGVVLLRRR
jgi:uncharacterized membrane protein